MLECPICGSSDVSLVKDWKYRDLKVKFFKCSSCKKSFKAYYRENKLFYTIPKKKTK